MRHSGKGKGRCTAATVKKGGSGFRGEGVLLLTCDEPFEDEKKFRASRQRKRRLGGKVLMWGDDWLG